MKRLFAFIMALSLCLSLCACAEKNEPLTEVETTEAVNPQYTQALELINSGDYIAASAIIYDHPEFEDYDELTRQCGANVATQYIKQQGEEKETGKFFIKLAENDGVVISVWYIEETNALQFVHSYSSGMGSEDGMIVDYSISERRMLYARISSNLGQTVNTQNGSVTIANYTGSYAGSNIDNSNEPLVIPGLSITSYTTAYDKQTRGYHIATMSYINEMIDALYQSLVQAGYKGSLADMGFTAYKTEQTVPEVTENATISPEVFERIKAHILENGTKKEGAKNFTLSFQSEKYVCPLIFIYAEEEDEIWVRATHMQEMNLYYQVALYISAENNTVSFETQHASLDSSVEGEVRIIKGTGVLERQTLTALTPVAFAEITDNSQKGIPEGYAPAFSNRIHGVLAALDAFMVQNKYGSLTDFGFSSYTPAIQLGETTFAFK